MADSSEVIQFGKHKGVPIDMLRARDPAYLEWLTAQPWFRERYPQQFQLIINYNAEPSDDTPEHNAMAVRFLDKALAVKVVGLVLKINRSPEKLFMIPEHEGWDWVFYSPNATDWSGRPVKGGGLGVELKTTVGDDWPKIIRQMNAHGARHSMCIIIDSYCGTTPFESVRSMFAQAGIRALLMDEVINFPGVPGVPGDLTPPA